MNEIADTSQTTDGSSPSSTTGSSGGSTMPVEQKYHSKKWQFNELKKALSPTVRNLISRHYNQFKYGKSEEKIKKAIEFFHTEFPGRSPYAVYHKSYYLHRRGLKTIVLLGSHD